MIYIICLLMIATPERQQDRAVALLEKRGMARLREFIAEGITPATISRMAKKRMVLQLSRGLYQLPDAPLDANHSLAEAAKLVPNGVICLRSALAFHELTDDVPAHVWVAIGLRDWRPRITNPLIRIVGFPRKVFKTESGKKTHKIERVSVSIYEPAKTIADLFFYAFWVQRRNYAKIDITLPIRGMKEALRLRKATPAEIAHYAAQAGIWEKVQPYLEALTVDA